MQTKQEIKMCWGPEHCRVRHDIVIPAGTRVVPCNDSSNQFFVDDLSWINPTRHPILHHDAAHYGIRLNADQIDGDKPKFTGLRGNGHLAGYAPRDCRWR